jgi:hypothetical protein
MFVNALLLLEQFLRTSAYEAEVEQECGPQVTSIPWFPHTKSIYSFNPISDIGMSLAYLYWIDNDFGPYPTFERELPIYPSLFRRVVGHIHLRLCHQQCDGASLKALNRL